MAVNASKEGLEQMRELINECASTLFKLRDTVFDYTSSANWEDETGSGFINAINSLNTTIVEPIPGLKKTRDKVDKLIYIVNKYSNLNF